MLNQFKLENDLINQLILCKYPLYKDVTLKRNIKGDII